MDTKERIIELLKNVSYPGFSKDIVTLGAVEGVDATPDSIVVAMKTLSADESALDGLTEDIRKAIGPLAGSAEIHVVYGGKAGHSSGESCGTSSGPSPFNRKKLPGVKRIVPIVSGKGGVGKSTVAVNLAATLSRMGNKVGLLDLDIFGPSIHKMLGVKMRLTSENNQIIPAQAHGMKVISVGMAVEDDEAMILRGPMVMKLLNQLINQVKWEDLDYLIVDMPPGTGDVPLSLAQQLDITGAVVITTPQDISLTDVRRGIAMLKTVETHILGIVENMSHYICESCGDVAHIFGKDGGQRESERANLPLLGQIPLVKSICEQADAGAPIVDPEKSPEIAKVFEDIAAQVIEKCDAAQGAVPSKGEFISASISGGSCSG